MSIGIHVYKEQNKSLAKSIEESVNLAKSFEIHMGCCQIFVVGPMKYTINLSIEDKKELLDVRINKYVHASHLTKPWGEKSAFGKKIMKEELHLCDEIDASGYIIHLDKKTPVQTRELFTEDLQKFKTCIFLEISASRGENSSGVNAKSYETIENLHALILEMKTLNINFGICIDTAHLWAAGTDISSWGLAKSFFEDLLNICVENDVKLVIHLNDQVNPRGSGKDVHASLFYGTIWRPYSKHFDNSGLHAIVEIASANNIDCILERHADRPKLSGEPVGSNIDADFITLAKAGYYLDN